MDVYGSYTVETPGDFGCEAAMRSSTSLAKVTSAFRLWSPGHSSCGLSLLAWLVWGPNSKRSSPISFNRLTSVLWKCLYGFTKCIHQMTVSRTRTPSKPLLPKHHVPIHNCQVLERGRSACHQHLYNLCVCANIMGAKRHTAQQFAPSAAAVPKNFVAGDGAKCLISMTHRVQNETSWRVQIWVPSGELT